MVDMPPGSRDVYSSNVQSIGYEATKVQLYVQYKTGAIYIYTNVDPKTAEETMNAPSIGDALQPIKKNPQKYPYKGPL